MSNQIMGIFAAGAMCASALFAQNIQRQATMTGGGSPERGKCTIEVVVDGGAQVEIRGATASLRTTSGRPAQWRRFECTSPMPANPAEFRFSGVDGRGRQNLVRDPRNGGAAVVQIEDREGGAEGYTFDIEWGSRGGAPTAGRYPDRDRDRYRGDNERDRWESEGQYRPDYRNSEYYRRYGHPFGTNEATRVCQESVLAQAQRRFRTRDIHFDRTAIDDNPGRRDWVTGVLDLDRGRRHERFRFSCSVNFDNGRVRTAEIEPRPLP
jgi:hypothetical protein